jgi:hypothetical protein
LKNTPANYNAIVVFVSIAVVPLAHGSGYDFKRFSQKKFGEKNERF